MLVITGTLFPPSRPPLRKLGIPVACYGTGGPASRRPSGRWRPSHALVHAGAHQRAGLRQRRPRRAGLLPADGVQPATHAPAPTRPTPVTCPSSGWLPGAARDVPGLAWAGVNTHGRWMPDIDLQVRGTLWHLDLDAEQGATGGSQGSRYAEGSIDNEETVRWHRSAAIALNMHRRMARWWRARR